jgi:hypothetical protein
LLGKQFADHDRGLHNDGYHSQMSGVPRFFPDGFVVKSQDIIGISFNPSPDYEAIAHAFDGYGEKVEEPGESARLCNTG